MNEEIEINVRKLRPFTRFIYTIGELPTSYLMSMTYEEQLIWLCNYLSQTVIPAVNNNAEATEELQNLFIELQEYVNHYFDNLDVQEEINEKLDEMAQDGSLTNIIKNYVDPRFNEYTNELNNEFNSYKNEVNSQINLQNNNISTISQNQTTLSQRMDEFTSLTEGSTTGDAELIDGRTSFDGITYSNIGGNIRNSDEKINERLNDYINTNILKNMTYTTGILEDDGTIKTTATNYITTDEFVEVTGNTNYYFKTIRYVVWYHDSTLLRYDDVLFLDAYDMVITSPATANKCKLSFELTKQNSITMNLVNESFTSLGTNKVKDCIGVRNNLLYGKTTTGGYFSNGHSHGGEQAVANYNYYSAIKVQANHTYTVYPRVRFVCLYENYYTRELVGDMEISSDPSASEQSFTPDVDGYVYVTVYKSDYDDGLCKMVDTTSNTNVYPVDARLMTDTFIPNETTINYIKSKLTSDLEGKVIYNFGDSIANGSGNDNVGYAEYMRNLYGCVVTDYAVGGATLSKVSGQAMSSILDQIDNASSTTPDIILLEGGANDYTQAREMGNMTSEFEFNSANFDSTTYIGALEMALNKLITKYPGTPIIWLYTHRENTRTEKTVGSVTVNFTTMHDRSLETCKKWSIPVIDIYNESGLNTMLSYYRTTYTYNSDGTHPNSYGYIQFYLPYVKDKIIEVLNI